jgi:hypothetical protein
MYNENVVTTELSLQRLGETLPALIHFAFHECGVKGEIIAPTSQAGILNTV